MHRDRDLLCGTCCFSVMVRPCTVTMAAPAASSRSASATVSSMEGKMRILHVTGILSRGTIVRRMRSISSGSFSKNAP